MHKPWGNIEGLPFCFSKSSIKFQGHTGQKIEDLNPIWVRLLGRSQLSNPSDLPSFTMSYHWIFMKLTQDIDPMKCLWYTISGRKVKVTGVIRSFYLKKYSHNPIQTWFVHLLAISPICFILATNIVHDIAMCHDPFLRQKVKVTSGHFKWRSHGSVEVFAVVKFHYIY